MQITGQMLKAIGREIEDAAREIAKKHGVSISYAGGTYGDRNVVKFQIASVAADGTVETPEREFFKRMATLYGLSPDDLGKDFRSGTTTYRIIGLSPAKRKYPIIAEHLGTGKRYKFSELTVKMALAK